MRSSLTFLSVLLSLANTPTAVHGQSQNSSSSSSSSVSTSAAASSGNATSASTSTSSSFSPTPVTTSVPSATANAALNGPVLGQGSYPPQQAWCGGGLNETYCPSPLLQDVELAAIFPDSKTFVDKPTKGNLNATLVAFNSLGQNVTVEQIIDFVNANFKGEGLELEQVPIEGFVAKPRILDNITDPIYEGWVSIVNSYWTLLIRQTNQSALCQPGTCESSLIPLNNTIVVPGGRYREIYYWDSYWVLQGLLKSELYGYATSLIENFMDFVSLYGFIPNGGRKYYLNRSQPPVFIQMLNAYVLETGNSSILERALPLADLEMKWWDTNRSISVTSPYTNTTHSVFHYDVFVNTAPRPEGYVEDYTTVMESSPALNATQMADLYSELATGAESGWDYSSRWCRVPVINVSDNNPALRTLNVKAQIPVDLTALMAGNHALLANLYEVWGNASTNGTSGSNSSSSSTGSGNSTSNSTATGNSTSTGNSTATGNGTSTSNATSLAAYHRERSQNLSKAALDLHWDSQKAWFYDFNMSANARASLYTPAGTFALWQNITPPEIVGNETAALAVVSGARYLLGRYAGIPSVASLLLTGLNWDFPNSWPPHAYTSIKAFETLGRAVPNATILSNITLSNFSAVTTGQLGLNETDLPPQPASTVGNTSLQTMEAAGKPWPLALSIEYANRYMTAAFCSWYSTGGSINGTLTQLPISDLNATGQYQPGEAGVMFEKFNATDPDAAGGGGEYEVVTGFGWTNGVVLWIAGAYGRYLPQPTCPLIPIISNSTTANSTSSSNSTSAPSGSNQTLIFSGYRIPPAK